MSDLDYWEECISDAAEECELKLTEKQLAQLAKSVSIGHDQYSMSFYSPPAKDRLNEIEREWKIKCEKLQKEFDAYRGNAETAIKQALDQHRDSKVSIEKDGEVFRCDGRIERIL